MCRKSRALVPLLLVGVSLVAAGRASAQIGFDTAGTRPLGISVSGAVSMGAYQAGMNWALLELLRQAHHDSAFRGTTRIPRYRLAAVSGASAGNINTLLWAIEACTERPVAESYRWTPPDSSLFWQVWVGIGLSDMLRPKDPTRYELSLLNLRDVRKIIDPLIRGRLEDADDRLRPGCSVPMGISLTRVRPDTLMLKSLSIETQRFATIFTARVDTSPAPGDERMRFHHDDDARVRGDRRFGKLVQLLPRPGVIHTHAVLEAVQASSSYPIAFEPVRLSVGDPLTNTESDEYFIDGGVFDNNPLSLVLALYAARNGGIAAPPVDVLYINPRQLRGAMARARRRPAEDVSPGGLATLLTLLDGAIGTARQYELQLIARERDAELLRDSLFRVLAERDEAITSFVRTLSERDSVLARRMERFLASDTTAQVRRLAAALRASDTLPGGVSRDAILALPPGERYRLFVSSRAHPVFGQYLASFASFLGRPLREVDFWVGAYDALHLVVESYICGEKADECGRREIAGMLRNPALVPEPGRSVMIALHDAEFAAGEPRLASSVPSPEYGVEVERERAVLLALASAMVGADRETVVSVPCEARTVLGQFLCRDGLAPALAAFRDDIALLTSAQDGSGNGVATVRDAGVGRPADAVRTLDIVREWSKDPSCVARRPLACRAEPEFVELVEHPERVVDRHLGQLLERLIEVEHRLRDNRLAHHSWPTQAIAWFYYNSEIGREPRPRLVQTSIPDRSRSLLRYAPHYLGAQIGASGYEARYRLVVPIRGTIPNDRRSRTRGVVLSFPLILHWNAGPKVHERVDWYAGVGAGIGLRTKLPVSLMLSEIGVQVNGYHALEHERLTVVELEPYANLVAGAVRLGVRLPHHRHRGRLYGDYPWSVSVGINDVGGLLYWATR